MMADDGHLDLKKVRILNPRKEADFPYQLSTRLYPEWALAALPQTSIELSERVVMALLRMAPESVAAVQGHYVGWTVPVSDKPVRDLMRELGIGPYAVAASPLSGTASAEKISVEAVLAPQEKIRLNFEGGSKHFVLMVRRTGNAVGNGPLAGAGVTEYGMHDLVRGKDGDPRGYLVFAHKDGSKAYIKFRVRAMFVPGPKGKPRLLDNGYWEVVGTTGSFKGMKGAGTMHIKPASKTERRFILNGDLVAAK
jgi:hypothetical protein